MTPIRAEAPQEKSDTLNTTRVSGNKSFLGDFQLYHNNKEYVRILILPSFPFVVDIAEQFLFWGFRLSTLRTTVMTCV